MVNNCYLEDYNIIKVITNGNDVKMENENIKLKLLKEEHFDERHLTFETSEELKTNEDYYLLIDGKRVHLSLGKITRTPAFDVKNYYDGPLGFEYFPSHTVFRLWSPVLKEVTLCLNDKKYPLEYKNNHWEVDVKGNHKNKPYYYVVRINEEPFITLDPYGVSGNQKVNYVVDLASTYSFKARSYVNVSTINDAIIYEAHLKDLSYPTTGSYYLATKDKIPYLKDLGITHLQIMPINSFFGVDEEQKDELYNWGYNPLEYMNPTGWYAKKPNHPTSKINEIKKMVDAFHMENIGINLDVVFNHVYKDTLFSYGMIVPGYVFRCDDRGFMSDGSGCGNDLATEHLMIRRLIIDTCKYYASFYQFDGFRFDLMGLIDIETLQELEKALKAINPNILLYGEGWVMNSAIDIKLLANLNNKDNLPSFGFFNDSFRNTIVGNQFTKEKGFIMERPFDSLTILKCLCGSDMPSQSINYLECHDNYTLNDYLEVMGVKDVNKKKDYLKFGLALLMLSIGTPFIHAGMEFGRTKNGENNSYKSSIDINKIDWSKVSEYKDVISYLKKLIDFRKTHRSVRINHQEIIKNGFKLLKEEHYIHYFFSEEEYIITNNYQEINIHDIVINKPGVYVFQDKKRIL